MADVTAVLLPVAPPPRRLTVRGRNYSIAYPSIRDPRLHLAAVITSLQVLGQTVFGFEVSIAQILLSLATCALIEFTFNLAFRQLIAWPASALLTGNGIAFLLRVNGTRHGQWWSLNGWLIFVATAAIGILSKYLIRIKGRPLFNPSNVALLLCFLVLGSGRVNPLDLWWGHHSAAMVAVYAIILTGGITIIRRVDMVPASLAFAASFAAGAALVAQRGHCFTARWHVGPVCGTAYEQRLVFSPEILIFLFFMITDPKTAPVGRVARVVYGSLVGFLAAALAATQRTEYGTKVAVLGALTLLCAARPLLEWLLPAAGSPEDRVLHWVSHTNTGSSWIRAAARTATALGCAAAIIIAVAAPIDHNPVLLTSNGESRIDPSRIAVADRPAHIDPAVDRLDGSFSATTARTMAHDLLVGLATIDDARARGDLRLAGLVVTPRELIRLRADEAAGNSRSPYRFDDLTIVVVRDSAGFQAGPKIAVRGVGTYADGTAFDRTFMLAEGTQRYLIDGQIDTTEVRLD